MAGRHGRGDDLQFPLLSSGRAGLLCARNPFCGSGSFSRHFAVVVCHRHQTDQPLFWQRTLLWAGVPDEAARNSIRRLRRVVLAVDATGAAVFLAHRRGPRRSSIRRRCAAIRADLPTTFSCRSVSELLVLDLVLRARVWRRKHSAGREGRVTRLLAVGRTSIRDLGDHCSWPNSPHLEPFCPGARRVGHQFLLAFLPWRFARGFTFVLTTTS